MNNEENNIPTQPVQPQPESIPVVQQPVQPTEPVKPIQQPFQPVQTELPTQNNEEDPLLQAFIGENYKKITTRIFNIPAFFLGSLYMYYRKMFIYGMISVVLALTAFFATGNFLLTLILNLLIGFLINKIYVATAKKKINKLKKQSPDNLTECCSKKGGTSVGLAFLGGFINVIIFAIAIIVAVVVLKISLFNTTLEMAIKDNTPSAITNQEFEGWYMNNTNTNLKNEFDITIPDVFKIEDEEKYKYEYTYEGDKGFFNKCSFLLTSVDNYEDSDTLINGMYKYYVKDEPVINKDKINNINWSWFSIINDEDLIDRAQYWYTTSNGTNIYFFKYEIEKNADPSCEQYKDDILNSMKLK